MELELYSTIEYTAGWYYRNFPGFYTIDCYKILADYSQNPSKYTLESGVEESKGVEYTEEERDSAEEEQERTNKKIRLSDNIGNGL
jgi:hypothetical protein